MPSSTNELKMRIYEGILGMKFTYQMSPDDFVKAAEAILENHNLRIYKVEDASKGERNG